MRAIAEHATVATITATSQPVFAIELQRLGSRFAQRYGANNLPSDWEELHVTPPKWAATSIDYTPSPDARMAADPGVIFHGAQLAHGSKSSMRCKAADQESDQDDLRQARLIVAQWCNRRVHNT